MSDVHPSLLVFLLDEGVRAVRAVYEKLDEEDLYRSGACTEPMAYGQEAEKKAAKLKGYLFKTMDQTLEVGDLCVVPTDTRHGFTVVKLVDVDCEPDMSAQHQTKWIVGKVQVDQYFETIAQEKSILDRVAQKKLRKQKEELRKTLLGSDDDFADMKLAIGLDADIAEAKAEFTPPPSPKG